VLAVVLESAMLHWELLDKEDLRGGVCKEEFKRSVHLQDGFRFCFTASEAMADKRIRACPFGLLSWA